VRHKTIICLFTSVYTQNEAEMFLVDFSCFVLHTAGMTVVVKLEGSPQLCKTDEVGELCLSSGCCATGYWGLAGVSSNVFKASYYQ